MRNKLTSTSIVSTSLKGIAVFVFLVASSSVFAQSANSEISNNLVATSAPTTTVSESVNFMSWFMGTKQNIQTESLREASGSNKKQLINSGIAPNRLLMKIFMKKATLYTSAVA